MQEGNLFKIIIILIIMIFIITNEVLRRVAKMIFCQSFKEFSFLLDSF